PNAGRMQSPADPPRPIIGPSPDPVCLACAPMHRGATGVSAHGAHRRREDIPDMASATPSDRLYSESHEWHKAEGDTVTLGLTSLAVEQITDVTYVQMKPKGTKLKAGDAVGEVESVKTTSDVYCAVAGEIIEVNGAAV